jgi:hypothetical protein
MTPGEKNAAEAFAAFDRWREIHDPDDLDILESITRYAKWCETHRPARPKDLDQP